MIGRWSLTTPGIATLGAGPVLATSGVIVPGRILAAASWCVPILVERPLVLLGVATIRDSQHFCNQR